MLGVTSFAGTGTVNVMGGITKQRRAHLGGGVITVGGNVVTQCKRRVCDQLLKQCHCKRNDHGWQWWCIVCHH